MSTTTIISDDLRQQLDSLPPFSQRVLASLLEQLYAEPNFSDVEAADIAKAIKAPKTSMGGAIAHLVSVGLVQIEDHDVNGRNRQFLHSPLHNDETPDLKQAVIDYLNGDDEPVPADEAPADEAPADEAPKPTQVSTPARRESKRARRIIRNYLRAAAWVAFAEELEPSDLNAFELAAATDAFESASALLATLDGYDSVEEV